MFGEILDEIAEAFGIDSADLRRIPVDVVCDKKLYRGHGADRRFCVHLYPGEELFHPKLLIVLTETEVVWLSGSGNLTASGYCSNREIALLEEPENLTLPRPLRRLLGKLPGPAAALIRAETTDAPDRSARAGGRFVGSIDGPIGREFLHRPPRHVEDVIVLAPYFEATSGDDPLDSGCLAALRRAFPRARYRVYLPLLQPGRRPIVQGDAKLFKQFRDSLFGQDALRFYPVAPDPGPLHAKLVAITYRSSGGRRARLLVGSPNPSRRALLVSGGNVEIGWIADVEESKLRSFLDELDAGGGRSFDALQFQPLEPEGEIAWAALDRAVFDPLTRRLMLTWSDGHGTRNTDVFYASRRLAVTPRDRVQPFGLESAHGYVMTRPKPGSGRMMAGKKIVPGYCPIEIPLEDQIFVGTVDEEMTPEDWLKLLGCDPVLVADGQRGSSNKNGSCENGNGAAFEISDRVRDLGARLRHVLGQLRVKPWSPAEREAMYKVLRGVFESHDPRTTNWEPDRVWRAWVRAEVVAFAAAAATDRAVREQGEGRRLRELSRELSRAVDWHAVSTVVRRQLRHVVRGRA